MTSARGPGSHVGLLSAQTLVGIPYRVACIWSLMVIVPEALAPIWNKEATDFVPHWYSTWPSLESVVKGTILPWLLRFPSGPQAEDNIEYFAVRDMTANRLKGGAKPDLFLWTRAQNPTHSRRYWLTRRVRRCNQLDGISKGTTPTMKITPSMEHKAKQLYTTQIASRHAQKLLVPISLTTSFLRKGVNPKMESCLWLEAREREVEENTQIQT